MTTASISNVVGRLVDVLEASDVVYAFGGALALAAWSEPRATADVDIILWIEPDHIDTAIDLIKQADVEVVRDAARADALDRGMFVGRSGHVRVDVFVPSIPFYDTAKTRREPTKILGRQTWVHSAEVLAVFKMLFFRPKDLIDIKRMLEVQAGLFDRDFVRSELFEMLGDDERIRKWDAMCLETPNPGK